MARPKKAGKPKKSATIKKSGRIKRDKIVYSEYTGRPRRACKMERLDGRVKAFSKSSGESLDGVVVQTKRKKFRRMKREPAWPFFLTMLHAFPNDDISKYAVYFNSINNWAVQYPYPVWVETFRWINIRLEDRKNEIERYLQDKRPDMFVNTPINKQPDIMLKFMELFNWKLIPFNKFYIYIREDITTIQLWDKAVFVEFPIGTNDFRGIMKKLTPFIACLYKARVFSIGVKIFGNAKQLMRRFENYLHTDNKFKREPVKYACTDIRYNFDEVGREQFYETRDFKRVEKGQDKDTDKWVFYERSN
ncbi:hypothetical protein B9Z55_023630 [Caenorhabditis nigoni]|uniref:Uncharacterized protein n=1 Tax=Caenorhabditis nigoni TaxID=1611254 RepID=A0A2G5SR16_9PELO|nr:hypothetical protein B9Z55_023630 [Caenorhabditis nigoni]